MVEVPFRIRLGALKNMRLWCTSSKSHCLCEGDGAVPSRRSKKHASLVYKYDACLPSRKNRGSTDMMLKFYPMCSVTVARKFVALEDWIRLPTYGLINNKTGQMVAAICKE